MSGINLFQIEILLFIRVPDSLLLSASTIFTFRFKTERTSNLRLLIIPTQIHELERSCSFKSIRVQIIIYIVSFFCSNRPFHVFHICPVP